MQRWASGLGCMPGKHVSRTAVWDLGSMPTNITFRTQLIGGVAEFCSESELPLFAKALHLVELIVTLARYKEEGVRLIPQVYISNDVGAMTTMLPDGERIKIGTTDADVMGIKEALKKTAPLATDGWSVYLQDGDTLEFEQSSVGCSR
jgi:hypothetical protein